VQRVFSLRERLENGLRISGGNRRAAMALPARVQMFKVQKSNIPAMPAYVHRNGSMSTIIDNGGPESYDGLKPGGLP